ncbi:MAG TPA: O-antigen ligase family protein [Rhizomicrobium sp.]|nr:O-antigen ligase family protein [Rhizomicrobium sp.]
MAEDVAGEERRIPAFRQAPEWRRAMLPSILLAIALIYPLLISQLLTGDFLHPADFNGQINVEASGANRLNQAFWLLLFVSCAAAALMRRTRLGAQAVALWPLFLYLAWSVATLAWAVDPHVASRRLALQFCIVGAIWLPVAMIGSPTRVRRVVLYVLFYIVLLNALGIAVIERTALGYAGIFGQKNALGAVTALGLVTFLASLSARSQMDRIIALIGVPLAAFLLVYSRSKTSFILGLIVPALVYTIWFAARTLRIRPSYLVSTGMIFGFFVVAIFFGGGLRYQDVLTTFFHDATFTGRTEIWSFAWSNIVLKPYAGYGFNGFWGVGGGSAAMSSNNSLLVNILQSHNGYLDTLLETGFVGLGILVCFITVTVGHCSRLLRSDPANGAFCLSVAIFFMLHNFEESSAFRRFEPTWVIFLVAAATVAAAVRARRTAPSPQLAWSPA